MIWNIALYNSLLATAMERTHQLESANDHVHKPETETSSRLPHIQWNDHYFLAPTNSVLTEKKSLMILICWSLIVLHAWGLSMEGPKWKKDDSERSSPTTVIGGVQTDLWILSHTPLPAYTHNCLALWHTDNSLIKASVLPQIYSTKGYSRLLHVLFQWCHSNGRGQVREKHTGAINIRFCGRLSYHYILIWAQEA